MPSASQGPNLFTESAQIAQRITAPLAARLRPSKLDEIVGQDHLLGPGKPLRILIEQDRLPSMVFTGPAGCGKTTLARVIAAHTGHHFEELPATSSATKDIKDAIERARQRLEFQGQRTLIWSDEIHRFPKNILDLFLPHVESGLFTLIGATTENPYFEINGPLLSRLLLFQLEPINEQDMRKVLLRGATELRCEVEPDAIDLIIRRSGGDARGALTLLEITRMVRPSTAVSPVLTVEDIEATSTQRMFHSDEGDFYVTTRALIAAVFSSDPDAALYWLARSLKMGIPPEYIARRMEIISAEEIGIGNPNAIVLASAVATSVHRVGMPESGLILAELVVYLANSRKSMASSRGWWAAQELVNTTPEYPVPLDLQITTRPNERGEAGDYSDAFLKHRHSDSTFATTWPPELVGTKIFDPDL